MGENQSNIEDPFASSGFDQYGEMVLDDQYAPPLENKNSKNGVIILVAVVFVLLGLISVILLLLLPKKDDLVANKVSSPTIVATPTDIKVVDNVDKVTPTPEPTKSQEEPTLTPTIIPATTVTFKKIVITRSVSSVLSPIQGIKLITIKPNKVRENGFVFDPNGEYKSCESNSFCHDNLCSECGGGYCGKPPGFTEYKCLTKGR